MTPETKLQILAVARNALNDVAEGRMDACGGKLYEATRLIQEAAELICPRGSRGSAPCPGKDSQ